MLVLSRTPRMYCGESCGDTCPCAGSGLTSGPPKPQGILGCAGPHWVVVNYPPVFLLDMSKAGGDTAGPAALFTSAMLLSRTLCSFLKGRIWQDRKGEMQIFSFSFVFFFFS